MSKSNLNLNSIDDILTEKEVLNLLGVKKSALEDFRYNQKLPFCKVNRTNRIYLLKDVLDFVASKRIIMNVHN